MSPAKLVVLFSLAIVTLLPTACGEPGEFETVTDTVNVPGNPQGLVIDSQGKFAYINITNGSALLVLNLTTHEFTSSYPVSLGNYPLDDIDDTDSLVAFHGTTTAGTVDVKSGAQKTLLKGHALYGAAFAGNSIYAVSYNDRGVHVASIDGAGQRLVTPYSQSGTVAVPISIASSPDGSTVVFGDEVNQALHVISATDNVVTATIAVGIEPQKILFLDNDRLAAVRYGAAGVNKCDTPDEPGTLILVDLTNPLAVPQSFEIDSLGIVRGWAVDPTGNRIFIVRAKQVGCYKGRKDREWTLYQPEVVVFDLLTEEVTGLIHLKQDESAPLNRPFPIVENLRLATYDLKLTPDGNTLLVVGTGKVYFLE